MFETDIGFTRASASELPHDVLDRFRALGQIVSHRSTIPWMEHCTECSMPNCFTTCEFYTPRPDLKCRRFREGFVAVPVDGAAVNDLMKITFRKWARLEGFGTPVVVETGEAISKERQDQSLGSMVQGMPMPWGLKLVAMGGRYALKRRAAFGAKPTAQTPNRFVVECFNPNPDTVLATLTMRPRGEQAHRPFQHRLVLEPGYNRILVPAEAIEAAIDTRAEFLIQIELDERPGDTVLYFGLVDFARVAEDALAAQAAGPAQTADAQGEAKKPKRVKCVVWDLDNTLWKGTLIEDGLDKLVLNETAVALIKAFDERGILNSIASKNNAEDALAAVRHFGLEDYFLYPQVSWNPKSTALGTIAHRLNIGIDTFVFIDDQPFERAEVEAVHDSVLTFDPLTDLDGLLEHPLFDVPVTAESRKRRQFYREQISRDDAFEGADTDYETFLRGCGLELRISPLSEEVLRRVHELAQRTNQMNFSGNRYNMAAIRAMMTADDLDTYVLSAADKFGEYGIIGFAVVDRSGPLMKDLMFSCRIQAKHVDRALMMYLLQTYHAAGADRFEALYNETPRNQPAAQLFWDLAFETAGTEGSLHRLVYDFGKQAPPAQDIVRVIVEDQEARPEAGRRAVP